MTPKDAYNAMCVMQPVAHDGIIYTRIRAVEYHYDRTVRLQLYDQDAHSITTVPAGDAVAVTPGEYAAYKERRRQEHDALEHLLAAQKEAKP